MGILALWNVTQYYWVSGSRHFKGKYFGPPDPCEWRLYIPSTHQEPLTLWCCVTFHKTRILSCTAVKTSNLHRTDYTVYAISSSSCSIITHHHHCHHHFSLSPCLKMPVTWTSYCQKVGWLINVTLTKIMKEAVITQMR